MSYANPLNLSGCWLRAAEAYDAEYDNEGDYSCTSLISPVRMVLLWKRHREVITLNIEHQAAKILGQSIHCLLERMAEPGAIVEHRFYIEHMGRTIGLKPDIMYPLAGDTYILEDFKSPKVWAVRLGEKIDWERQTNLNAYAARLHGYNVTKLAIQALLKDWDYKGHERDSRYPKSPIVKLPIPVWTDAACEKYLTERLQLFILNEKTPDRNLPFCTPEERWARDSVFKVYRIGTTGKPLKTAIAGGAALQDRTAAERFAFEYEKTHDCKCSVRYSEGCSVRCQYFCDVASICSQWKQMREASHDTREI